jgi:hypothetical protein
VVCYTGFIQILLALNWKLSRETQTAKLRGKAAGEFPPKTEVELPSSGIVQTWVGYWVFQNNAALGTYSRVGFRKCFLTRVPSYVYNLKPRPLVSYPGLKSPTPAVSFINSFVISHPVL